MKIIDLDLQPFWEVNSSDKVDIYINGQLRGVLYPADNMALYSFICRKE